MTEAGEKENKEKAIRYLFGELDDAERDAIEDRLFDDDEFGLFLSAVEKDLVDDYVRDEMDAGLRQRFERRYLVSESRREKVRLAKVLQTEVFNEKTSAPEIAAPLAAEKPSFWATLADFFRVPNLALAGGLAVILLFLLIGGWILFRRAPNAPDIVRDDYAIRETPLPTPQISPENSPVNENSGTKDPNTENSNAAPTNDDRPPANENKAPEKRPTPAPRPTERREETPPQQNRSVFATLFPPLRSGDENPVLSLPKNAESVRLRVVHDNLKPFERYRVEIRNRKGEVIFTRETKVNAKNPARPIDVTIKAATLGAGTYELRLSGIGADSSSSDIKFYNFSVTKK
jgi:hypothetical protein